MGVIPVITKTIRFDYELEVTVPAAAFGDNDIIERAGDEQARSGVLVLLSDVDGLFTCTTR